MNTTPKHQSPFPLRGEGWGERPLPPIFNCSNDMALAANVRQYFPPKRIQQMEDDLKDLANYWEEGPWGWSLATKQRYKQMGVPENELPTDEWLATLRNLSSREFACSYIKEMLTELNDPRLLGHDMHFCKTLPPVTLPYREGWGGSLIFKSPWSSSGRGVFVAETLDEPTLKRLQGYLNTQGGFAMDRFYANKVLDFAMEFIIKNNGEVDFLGYSVFHADPNGAYGYNYVESQEDLKKRIDLDDNLLKTLINYHKRHLSLHIPPVTLPIRGEGLGIGASALGALPVGIDMIKCADGTIHPCIEINLRMNMGILALKLWDRFKCPNLSLDLSKRSEKGFQAKIDEGKLIIIYNK